MGRTKLKNVIAMLRHRSNGLSIDEIAMARCCSKATVSGILKRAAAAGIHWPLPEGMKDEDVGAALWSSSASNQASSDRLEPDWDEVAAQLMRPLKRREPRITRVELWRSHCRDSEYLGLKYYSRSRFYELLSDHMNGPNTPAEMRFAHLPGVRCMSDFSGKTLTYLSGSGPKAAEIFVCVLAHSRLIYATAVASQKLPSWTEAHQRAFEYFGGCSQILVIDNLKAGVRRWSKDGPELTIECARFGRHYNVAIIPTRPYRPRDKGMVENAVGAVQSMILSELRDVQFCDLQELDQAIRDRLEDINSSKMQSGHSRRELFEEFERSALQPLPLNRWEQSEWFRRKVGKNQHVRVDKFNYSVPHQHLGKDVMVRRLSKTVEIYLKETNELLTVHSRSETSNGVYITDYDHLSEANLEMVRRYAPDYGDHLLGKMADIGPNAKEWSIRCQSTFDFPQCSYHSLRKALRLANKYGFQSFDEICKLAVQHSQFTSQFLDQKLKAKDQEKGQETLRPHHNIRGAEYYTELLNNNDRNE